MDFVVKFIHEKQCKDTNKQHGDGNDLPCGIREVSSTGGTDLRA